MEDQYRARLIPVSGIGGSGEQETRATSALLAVLRAVKEFRAPFLKGIGAPAGTLETFIEVPFKLGEKVLRPDGVLRVARGTSTWTALVEVKTGASNLDRDQVESYLELAKQSKFDAVVTISNEIASSPTEHPLGIAKAKLKVPLHHVSWSEIRSIAQVQADHSGVSDPDQAWILSELIRYLDDPRAGASDFSDMGADWLDTCNSLHDHTIRPTDKGLPNVVARWEQLLRFAALRLERRLGPGVQVVQTRKEAADGDARRAAAIKEFVETGRLIGRLKIPNTVGILEVTADVKTGRCRATVTVDSPTEGKPTTRINWLLKQIDPAVDNRLVVECWQQLARTSSCEPMTKVRENPACLFSDPKADIRRFVVTANSPLGTQRGLGPKSFIHTVLAAIDGFYENVLQDLAAWAPKAPQVSTPDATATEIASLTATTNDATDAADVQWAPPAETERVDVPVVSWDTQLVALERERELASS
jgi:hypothetical protein